jgi:small subunit ribosomal protein S16
MLAIRMARVGRKKQAMFRIVVSEKKRDMYGDHLEIVGNYNPQSKVAVLKADRIKYWLSMGAVASASLQNLLIKQGVITGKKAKSVSLTNKRRVKMAAKVKAETVEAKVEAPVAETKEEVVEEAAA